GVRLRLGEGATNVRRAGRMNEKSHAIARHRPPSLGENVVRLNPPTADGSCSLMVHASSLRSHRRMPVPNPPPVSPASARTTNPRALRRFVRDWTVCVCAGGGGVAALLAAEPSLAAVAATIARCVARNDWSARRLTPYIGFL